MPSPSLGKRKSSELSRLSKRGPSVVVPARTANPLRPKGRSAPKTTTPKKTGRQYPGSTKSKKR